MTGTFQQTAGTIAAGHQEMVGRARALVPVLRERAAEADRLRKVPDANIIALRQAGLLKVLQSHRYGGYQMSLRTHIDVVAELGRGCTSTAWCAGIFHAHSWLMGLFPEAAQQDSSGTDPDAIVSAVIAPRGKARAVDGGFVLNGFWPFASGCEHSHWLFLALSSRMPAARRSTRAICLSGRNRLPSRTTGTCPGCAAPAVAASLLRTCLCRSIVPVSTCRNPGSFAWRRTARRNALSVRRGAGAGAGDHSGRAWGGRTRVRKLHNKARRQGSRLYNARKADRYASHPPPGRRGAHQDRCRAAAAALLRRCHRDGGRAWRGDGIFETRPRPNGLRPCGAPVPGAVETLYLASGGSGIVESNPTQRAWRDVHAINMHGVLNLQTNQEMYGRLLLDLPPNTPLI